MTGGFAQLFGLAEKRIDEFVDTPVVVATARPVEGDQNCAGRDGLDLVLLGDQIWIILVGDVRGHIVLLEGRNIWNVEEFKSPFRLDGGERRQRHWTRTGRGIELPIAHGLDRVALCHRRLLDINAQSLEHQRSEARRAAPLAVEADFLVLEVLDAFNAWPREDMQRVDRQRCDIGDLPVEVGSERAKSSRWVPPQGAATREHVAESLCPVDDRPAATKSERARVQSKSLSWK